MLEKRKDVAAAIKALIDTDPENGKITIHGDGQEQIQAHDVYHLALPYLEDKTKDLLKSKAYNLIYERNTPKPGKENRFNSILFVQLLNKLGVVDNELLNLFHNGSYDRKADMVNFVGFQLKLKEINVGLVRLAALLNAIVEDELATACLAPPTMIPILVPETNETEISLVCYIAINQDKQNEFDQKYGDFAFGEGGFPRRLK